VNSFSLTAAPAPVAAAQRRLLEALAAFHRLDPDQDPLAALLAGVREAVDLNADEPEVAAIFEAFFDLIGAVRVDLRQEARRG
jgi:hypothetical protein